MTAAIDAMVCGDHGTHREGCPLGLAETIAYEAATTGPHQLVAALQALAEAGLLRDVDPDDAGLDGVLDALYEMDLIGVTP